MKKILALLCAAALTVCTAVSALAAPSPSVSGVVTSIPKATDANGNSVQATMSESFSASNKAAMETVKTVEGLKAAMGADYTENMTVVDCKQVSVPEGTAFPLSLEFDMTGVTSATTVQIMYYNGTEWVKVPTTVVDGKVIGEFDFLSADGTLVAFIVDGKTYSGSTVSPKTGETNALAWGVAVAVLALGGMVVSCKKKRA